MSLFDNINFKKLKDGLSKTRTKIVNSISETLNGKAVVDDKTLDEIEEILITSDIGFDTTAKIITQARIRLHNEKNRITTTIIDTVKKELISVLEVENISHQFEIGKYKPFVILVVGVNGVGKTTTIGKLAHNFQIAGLKVLVGAADTFRAAAGEQLGIWAKRANVEIIQKEHGSDPSSVAYDTVVEAKKNNFDIVLIDTAGRLHNKSNLMEELKKIKNVMAKIVPYAPNETLLVLDATTGQNAILQADEFSKVTEISGLVVTKLDGTAKGGVVFQIINKQKIPIRYIGVGEKIDDLQNFQPKLFVDAIFDNT
ncbi:MAG: signal recognition particle-docking protein FtsY [Ignavibacteria bacterium CG2_30_36_16]|nr:MAG: signal recognition particle-docking protein FtsY [Ignavibacteria bacterium CG2_30_36_16]